jgi:hypothetical protein
MITKCFAASFALLSLSFDWSAAGGQSPISLDDLPSPPGELKRLIEASQVAFEFGGDATDRPFAAETHYQIAFDYKTRTTWRLSPNGRQLRIVMRLSRLSWQPRHRVWFRNRPASEGFWHDPLVLHEFDHVRLSSDPRWKEKLEVLTRNPAVIQHDLSNHEPVTRTIVNQVVDQYLQSRLQEVFDLIDIRYRELDRETAHGRTPLPDDSPLQEYLRDPGSDRSDR